MGLLEKVGISEPLMIWQEPYVFKRKQHYAYETAWIIFGIASFVFTIIFSFLKGLESAWTVGSFMCFVFFLLAFVFGHKQIKIYDDKILKGSKSDELPLKIKFSDIESATLFKDEFSGKSFYVLEMKRKNNEAKSIGIPIATDLKQIASILQKAGVSVNSSL